MDGTGRRMNMRGFLAERLLPLDSLRGLAAIGVAVFWHYQHFQPLASPFSQKMYWFYQYGWIGVDFFFVLSGFVFSHVYGKQILDHSISPERFAMLRISRLYPVFLVTTLLVACLQGARHLLGLDFFVYQYNDVYHFLLNLAFLHSGWFEQGFSFNAPSWSVACEATAYVIFFFVLRRYGNRRWLAFAAMVLLGLFLQQTQWELPLLNTTMERVFLGFFIGCIAYMIHEKIRAAAIPRIVLVPWAAAVLFLCVAGACLGHGFYGERWQTVYVLVLFPSLIIFSLHIPWLFRLLSFRPMTYLGDISYSVYLWHFPVQCILVTGMDLGMWHFDPSRREAFLLYVALIFLAGAISHHYEAIIQRHIRNRFPMR